MRIKVIKTDNDFDKVKEEWISFEKKVNNQSITSSYIWQRAWWKSFKNYEKQAFGYNKKLRILFLYNKINILRAIVPFCEVTRKARGLIRYKSIEFIAQQWGATYLDIISDRLNKEEHDFIFDWLKKNIKYDLIELKYIPEFTPNFELNCNYITIFAACPEIISDSYDLVRQKYYGKNLIHSLKRIRNKIKRESINLTTIHVSSDQILEHFAEIKEVSISKELSSKHSLYRDRQIESFVRNLINFFSENITCSLIIFNGKIVSYNFGFEINRKFYAWDAAYSRNEEVLQNLSLGNLNYDHLIRYVFSKKVKNLCLGTGIDPYKLKFSKQIIKIYTFLENGNSIKGKLFYILKKRRNRNIENIFFKQLKANMQKN